MMEVQVVHLAVQLIVMLVAAAVEVLVVEDQMDQQLLEVQVYLDKVVPAKLIHMEY